MWLRSLLPMRGGVPLVGHSLAGQTWATVQRWLLGYLLGSASGLIVGLLFAISE